MPAGKSRLIGWRRVGSLGTMPERVGGTRGARMFHRVMVPLDTSAFAEEAVERAALIARASGAVLELVVVHEFPALIPESAASADALWEGEVEEYRANCMAPEAANLSRNLGIDVEVVRLEGAVVPALTEHVAAHQVDLVVMTSHGRTGWGRAWLGSVADGLVRQSGVPVLVLRHGTARLTGAESGPAFRRILVPLDGSPEAEEVLDDVVALARDSVTAVILTRVIQPIAIPDSGAPVPDLVLASVPDFDATTTEIDAADRYLGDVVQSLRGRGVEHVESCVRVAARVGPALVELVHRYRPDLVAMTSHGRGASRLLAGSVADSLLRGSTCALLFRRQHPAVTDAPAAVFADAAPMPT